MRELARFGGTAAGEDNRTTAVSVSEFLNMCSRRLSSHAPQSFVFFNFSFENEVL
jgi:hypothetical protein